MIPKDTFNNYAQYHEDIILSSFFDSKKKGFYVDVGANHESFHSVTKYFYERGWSGINIEPIPRLIKEFEKKRTRDTNLNLAIAEKKGKLIFREYPDYDGLSTFSETSKKENDKLGLPHKDYGVEVDSLKNIFDKYKVSSIDFLKIDVEGFEEEVIKSNDWSKYRPSIICIEANHRKQDWEKILINNNYTLLIFDGLNEYYIANESKGLFKNFAERASIKAHNAIRFHHMEVWKSDLKHIDELRILAERQDKLIKGQEKAIGILEKENRSIKRLVKKTLKQIAIRLKIKNTNAT